MKFIKEHIFEIIGLIITFFGVDFFNDNLKHRYAGYIIAGIIFILFIVLVRRIKCRNPQNKVTYTPSPLIIFPYPQKICLYKETVYFEVYWNIFVGADHCPTEIRNYLSSKGTGNQEYENWIEQNVEIWTEDPYCTKCNCKLDTDEKKAKWICVNCGKTVKIPKKIWHDPNENIVKIFKSSWRKEAK